MESASVKKLKVIVLIILITSFIFNSPIEVLALQNNKAKDDEKRIVEICNEVRNTPVDEEELLKKIYRIKNLEIIRNTIEIKY